ncbi:hypothetical protein BU17DRAFT_65066 [Hysterangium stoloniferum]|nr:hypothetical protein BU17DRAFT_65066 [Hysterangium stoloniferum]
MSSVTDPSSLQGSIVVLVTQIYRITGALWILTLDVESIQYNSLMSDIRHQTCTFWFQYVGYSAGAEHMVVGGVLILRLYAMFDCNRKLLAVLLVLYVIAFTTETVLIGVITHNFKSNETLRSQFSGCAPLNIPLWCYWYWVPSMTFESILLLLALWKTVLEARKAMLKSSKLMVVLIRDSVLYFGGITLFTVANFLAWYIAPLPLYGMFVGCHIGFQSVLACRMLLYSDYLRQVYPSFGHSIITKFSVPVIGLCEVEI